MVQKTTILEMGIYLFFYRAKQAGISNKELTNRKDYLTLGVF
jgi:hypothetical protein